MQLFRNLMLGMVLGVAGCGGSGGSGGGGGASGSAKAPDLASTNLTGTWIESAVNYADLSLDGNYVWVKTMRDSVVVQDSDSALVFIDCVAGASALATKNGNQVDFKLSLPSLTWVDADTLKAEVTCDNCSTPSRTDVVLHRVSKSTRINQASIAVSQPVSENSWDQVCVKTIVDNYSTNSIQVKASKVSENVSVNMTVTNSTLFQQGTYNFPSADSDVSALLTTVAGSGLLTNPVGTIVETDGTTTDFQADLTMQESSTNSTIAISGLMSFDPQWFAGE